MKLQIEITQNGNEIIEIDINNGHWKIWEDTMEETQKQSLTINNLINSHYLSLPVKDVYSIHDHKLWEEKREIQTKEADVRTYDSLIEYLNCRIDNAKDKFKSNICDIMGYKETGIKYTAVLFEEHYKRHSEDLVTDDIKYESTGLIEVKINWVE